jgi:4-aminobutyrate aminotransferase-like enzyme
LALLYHPGGIHNNVLRLMLPLTIDTTTAKQGLQMFERAVQQVQEQRDRAVPGATKDKRR